MQPPSHLPRWAPMPLPVLLGVLASWVPVSASAVIGVATTVLVYFALVVLPGVDDAEPADAY